MIGAFQKFVATRRELRGRFGAHSCRWPWRSKETGYPISCSAEPGASVSGLLETVLVLFFLLVSGDLFLRRLVEVLPHFRNKRQAVEISQQIESDISAYLATITLMNAGVGVATGIVAAACGVGDPMLWGAVAFLLNYVPVLGPMIGVAIFLLAGLLSVDTLWGAFLPAALYLGIHIIEGEAVTPMLLARRFTINPVRHPGAGVLVLDVGCARRNPRHPDARDHQDRLRPHPIAGGLRPFYRRLSRCAGARSGACWCGRPDLNRHRACAQRIFRTYATAFAASDLTREIAPEGGFGESGLSLHPGRLGCRCCPSSLYTFPPDVRPAGLARDCHLRGFPDFEQFCFSGFPKSTQIALKSVASTNFATPAQGIAIALPIPACPAPIGCAGNAGTLASPNCRGFRLQHQPSEAAVRTRQHDRG